MGHNRNVQEMKTLKKKDKAIFLEADDGKHNTYYLESKKGRFVWYKKDNIIVPHKGSLKDFLKMTGTKRAYNRGENTIQDHCGEDVKILDEGMQK